jgi:hypothetical protein
MNWLTVPWWRIATLALLLIAIAMSVWKGEVVAAASSQP